LFQFVPALFQWADEKGVIRRLWLFGSRLRGTYGAESDLDIAIEIVPIGQDEDILTTWVSERGGWRAELQTILPYTVDLQLYDVSGLAPDNIAQYVSCCSALVYERAA
jgi:predicted nucleotidyltransferase